MIYLKGNLEHILFKKVKDKLVALSLEFKVVDSADTPYIIENDKEIKGEEQIFLFLDDLEKELKQWYYCQC